MLWACRNTPHSSTGEKSSFLLFGVDLRTPTEAAYLPVSEHSAPAIEDYQEELMISLSSARELATEEIQRAQARYKKYNDRQVRETNIRIADWILVYFPHEDTGRHRKLSRPWHGPYRVVSKRDPDLTCAMVPVQRFTSPSMESSVCIRAESVCAHRDSPQDITGTGLSERGPDDPHGESTNFSLRAQHRSRTGITLRPLLPRPHH